MRKFNYDKDLEKYYNKESLKLPKNEKSLNNFINKVSNKLNIEVGDMIGVGFEGQVYEIKNTNKVIKFQPRTCDDYSDIITTAYLLNKKLKNIAQIFEFGIVKITNNMTNNICINSKFNEIYYIISEKAIINKQLKKLFTNLELEYFAYHKLKDHWIDNDGDHFLSFIEDFSNGDPNQHIKKFLKKTKFLKEVNQIITALNELKEHDIYYNDFVVKNFGFDKDKNLILFDINGYEEKNDFNLSNKKRLII